MRRRRSATLGLGAASTITPVACEVAHAARATRSCRPRPTTAARRSAHVEIDRVAEQQDLHQRDADDHAEREAVARELPQLLQHARRRCARSMRGLSAARRLRRAVAESGRRDEHVLEARADGLDVRLDTARRRSRARTRSAGSRRRPGRAARAGACRAARRCAPPSSASERVAGRRTSSGPRPRSPRPAMSRIRSLRHALRDERARRRGSPGGGSARPRPCSASRPGS